MSDETVRPAVPVGDEKDLLRAAEIMESLDRNEPQPHTEVEHANLAHALRQGAAELRALREDKAILDLLERDGRISATFVGHELTASVEWSAWYGQHPLTMCGGHPPLRVLARAALAGRDKEDGNG